MASRLEFKWEMRTAGTTRVQEMVGGLITENVPGKKKVTYIINATIPRKKNALVFTCVLNFFLSEECVSLSLSSPPN